MRIKNVNINQIVIDETIYPRNSINLKRLELFAENLRDGFRFELGEQIQIARKRRQMTLDEMSSRMFVTRKTLFRLENGLPGVSLLF
jgi:DNA-binding XRE family transcriptional regulator